MKRWSFDNLKIDITVGVLLLLFLTCAAAHAAQDEPVVDSERTLLPVSTVVLDSADENLRQQLLSVNVDNAEIKNVLESLAYQANLSLALPETVQGKVSLRLNSVTWQTAMDSVLRAGGYTVTESNDVLFVSDQRSASAVEVFKLDFADADDMEKTINNLVSPGGKVGVHGRINSIVVYDNAENLERIRKAVEKLDTQAPQIMIDALIVNVKLTSRLKMGVDWTRLGTMNNYLNQSLSATTGSNPIGKINFSTAQGDWKIQGLMDFIETHEEVEILANPKVLVLNNHTATIESVEEIPYQESQSSDLGGNYVSTSFKKAGIRLNVTPQLTSDGQIIMHVKPEQSAQTSTFTVGGNDTPVIESRSAETTLRIRDGQTIIIGGLRKQQPKMQESKVPLLGDIPIIGMLFRKIDSERAESELGVFITPRVYTDGKLSQDEIKLLNMDLSKSPYQMSDPLRIKGGE